jgi:hypothetical protein
MITPTKTGLVVVPVVGILLMVLFGIFGGDYEHWRRERVDAPMRAMRDRVLADPTDHQSLELLIEGLNSDEPWERTTVAGYLGEIGPSAKSAANALAKTLNDPNDRRWVGCFQSRSPAYFFGSAEAF